MRASSIVVLSALSLAVAACADETTGTTSRLLRTAPPPAGLVLDIAVSPSRMALGDTATVTVTLTNVGPVTRTLRFPSGCTLHYEVESLDGHEVFPEGGGLMCAAVITTVTLQPGEREEARFRWTHRRFRYPPISYTDQLPGRLRFRPVLVDTPYAGDATADLEVVVR